MTNPAQINKPASSSQQSHLWVYLLIKPVYLTGPHVAVSLLYINTAYTCNKQVHTDKWKSNKLSYNFICSPNHKARAQNLNLKASAQTVTTNSLRFHQLAATINVTACTQYTAGQSL